MPAVIEKDYEAALEFIQTEKGYNRRLKILKDFLREESKEALSEQEIAVIFQNIDDLARASDKLMDSLELIRGFERRKLLLSLHELLSKELSLIEVFRSYCIGHSAACELIQSKEASNPKFASFIQEAALDPRCEFLDLTSFLLEPVQRLARYPLLLRQILHYCNEDGLKSKYLSILSRAEAITASINESVRASENQRELFSLKGRIDFGKGEKIGGLDVTGVTKSGEARKLLLQQNVYKCKSGRQLLAVVLSDLFILLEPKDHGKLYIPYRQPILLDALTATDIVEGEIIVSGHNPSTCFCVRTSDCKIFLAVEEIGDKKKFLGALLDAKARQEATRRHHRTIFRIPIIGIIAVYIGTCNLPSKSPSQPGPFILTLRLNRQSVELEASMSKGCLSFNKETLLSLSSLDDVLEVSLLKHHKYSPNELLGTTELKLDLLEYYRNRATDMISLSFTKLAGSITIRISPNILK